MISEMDTYILPNSARSRDMSNNQFVSKNFKLNLKPKHLNYSVLFLMKSTSSLTYIKGHSTMKQKCIAAINNIGAAKMSHMGKKQINL